MNIIPAIQLINGRCSSIKKHNENVMIRNHKDPIVIAKEYEANGVKKLYLADFYSEITGKINWSTLKNITNNTNLEIDFSGNIKSDEDIIKAFSIGAKRIFVGRVAIENPTMIEKWIEAFSPDRIIIRTDILMKKYEGNLEHETSMTDLFDFIDFYSNRKIESFVFNVSIDLYVEIMKKFPHIKLIAGGGVSNWADINALKKLKIHSVIINTSIYEKIFSKIIF